MSSFFPAPSSHAGSAAAQPAQPVLQSRYRIHRVESAWLDSSREVIVYLPEAYFSQPQRRFPVLYLHDGNNLFEPSTSYCGDIWAVDEVLEAGVAAGLLEPVILVGIYNSPQRVHEYTWHPLPVSAQRTIGGKGPHYCAFVVQELKSLIDASYRTLPQREHSAIMGSSMGGLISFYFGLHYSEVFSCIGMMSPSLGWKDGIALREARQLSQQLKIWVDVGTQECFCHQKCAEWSVANTSAFVRELEAAGFRHFENLAFHIAPGADHSERAWAARVQHPLRFFFGREQARLLAA